MVLLCTAPERVSGSNHGSDYGSPPTARCFGNPHQPLLSTPYSTAVAMQRSPRLAHHLPSSTTSSHLPQPTSASGPVSLIPVPELSLGPSVVSVSLPPVAHSSARRHSPGLTHLPSTSEDSNWDEVHGCEWGVGLCFLEWGGVESQNGQVPQTA